MNKYVVILGCLIASVCCGCSGEEEDDLIDLLGYEKEAIHQYLSQVTSPIERIVYYSSTGLLIDTVYIYNREGGGQFIKDTGWVMMDFDIKTIDGRILDSTDTLSMSNMQSPDIPTYLMGGPVLHGVDTSKKFDYITEAFRHIGEGGSGEMLVPSMLSGAKDGKAQIYKLKSHKIIQDLVANEKEFMQNVMFAFRDSIVEEPIQASMGPDSIAYVLVNRRGVGERKIQPGDSLVISTQSCVVDEVNFQNGVIRMYQQKKDTTVYTDKWSKSYTTGYLKGIQHLKQGDRAFILVSYIMGYGGVGSTSTIKGSTKKPFIVPPFATLMYIVDVEKVAAPLAVEKE